MGRRGNPILRRARRRQSHALSRVGVNTIEVVLRNSLMLLLFDRGSLGRNSSDEKLNRVLSLMKFDAKGLNSMASAVSPDGLRCGPATE